MIRMPVASLVLAAALARAHPASAQLSTGDGLLVTPQWLAHHQHDRDMVILQVGPPTHFPANHIAGSQFIELRDISTPFQPGTLNLEMPPEADLISAFEKRGVSDKSKIVVVFDSEWVSPSTRVLFTLGYLGLGANAVLLDGGLAAWQQAGFPLSHDSTVAAAGHITTRAIPSLIVGNGYVAAHKSAPHARIIDARAANFFTGPANEHNQTLAGHVPGAASIPFTSVFTDDNFLLSKSKLDALFSAAGVQPGDTVVAYCHVGQQATAVLLAARVAGHPVRLYDGSFQDWSMRKLPTEGGN
jgi:thiosulfate/3-mercaptopyruvate sulfurtransferase